MESVVKQTANKKNTEGMGDFSHSKGDQCYQFIPFESLFAEPKKNGLTRPSKDRGIGYKMVNMGEIFAYDFIHDQDMERVLLSDREKDSYLLRKGDLLFARQSLTVEGTGKSTLVKNLSEETTFESHLIRCRLDNTLASPLYFYYFFRSPYARKRMSGLVSKVSAAGIKGSDLEKFPVPVVDLITQKQVADVLHSFDKKIELNRQLNDNLESMAQALYDYWFVQFDFPDENGKPYKSSGGKMVWNEQLKREIPEGWEVKQIREVADTCLGGTPVTNIREYWDGGNIPWISSGDLTSNPLLQVSDYITQKGLNNSAAKLMPKGTVVVSLVRYIRPSILGIDAAGNQSVVGIFANKILPTCFLYPYVKSEVPRLMGLRTGAQQPHINKEVIDSSFIVLPDNVSIMGQYQNRALGIYEKLLCVAKERESLTKQRDFLLPLLMNGQVQVKPLNYRLTDD